MPSTLVLALPQMLRLHRHSRCGSLLTHPFLLGLRRAHLLNVKHMFSSKRKAVGPALLLECGHCDMLQYVETLAPKSIGLGEGEAARTWLAQVASGERGSMTALLQMHTKPHAPAPERSAVLLPRQGSCSPGCE